MAGERKSTLNGRLAWVQRSHEHFAQRDFSGMAGNLDYIWTPTPSCGSRFPRGGTSVLGGIWTPAYTVSDTLSFTPTWQVSTKTALRMRLDCAQRDYRGPVHRESRPITP